MKSQTASWYLPSPWSCTVGQHPHEQCQSRMFGGAARNPPVRPESIPSRSHPPPGTPPPPKVLLV